MKVRKAWIGSKKAATLGNLAELQEDIHLDLQEIGQKMATKEDLTHLEERMGEKFATKETVAAILEIVKSIDKRLISWDWIPDAATDLKNRVFKLEINAKH